MLYFSMMNLNPPKTKVCRKCNQEFPYTKEYFWVSNQHKFGLRAQCRRCVLDYANSWQAEANKNQRIMVLTHYSDTDFPSCSCCGETQFEFLSLDHIEGSSQEDYRKYKTGATLLRNIIKSGFPPRFRVLCHNCNQCCRIYGYCVHNPILIKFHKSRDAGFARKLSMPNNYLGATQTCTKCRRVLPLLPDWFSKHKEMKTGLLQMCKDCQRIIQRQQLRNRKTKQRLTVFNHYSNGVPRCHCCGETTFEFLSIDHINGGGNQHRKNIYNIFLWLIQNDFPDGFQILCYSCNMAKGFYSKCPHSK